MGTLQENQSLNAEYERNKKEREMKKEIERLTELCNKYEEEHKTTFETWQKDIKENKLLHSIIKEAREYIVSQKLHKIVDTTGGLTYEERKLLEILDKVEGDNE